jgi:hypothetical protein
MEPHRSLSDQTFLEQFSQQALPPDWFSHEAHLRLAFLHIRQLGIEQAIDTVRKQLKAYVAHLGAIDKYHETLTVAAVRAVYHFMLREGMDAPAAHTRDEATLEAFLTLLQRHPRLRTSFRELMFAHYKTDIFSSAFAKKEYLAPELLPFD